MQQRSSRELWIACVIIVFITFIYLSIVLFSGSIPAAKEFFGHSLGIIGFILMLMTEILYSLRKRRLTARWGRISTWLNFHIITGLVGPYLVLLHTAWKFNGIAGLVMLLTVIIVMSGFVGRYIYTAVPRRSDGAEMEVVEMERLAHGVQSELNHWLETQSIEIQSAARRLIEQSTTDEHSSDRLIVGFIDDWRFHNYWRKQVRTFSPDIRRHFNRLEMLLIRRRRLVHQIQSLSAARQILALWHTIHVPIGMTLFLAAFIHIGAAIYYATLLR
jgi:hypothetical protein